MLIENIKFSKIVLGDSNLGVKSTKILMEWGEIHLNSVNVENSVEMVDFVLEYHGCESVDGVSDSL